MRPDDINLLAEMLNLADAVWTLREIGTPEHPLIASGILKRRALPKRVLCPCGNGHWEDVDSCRADDGTRRFRVFCDETSRIIAIPPEALMEWEVDSNALAAWLGKLFQGREDVAMVLSGRLWDLGNSAIPIAGMQRRIFFAPRLNQNAGQVYDSLPAGKTHLLIVGASQIEYSESMPDRIFHLTEVLGAHGGEVALNIELMTRRLAKTPEEKKERKPSGSRADAAEKLKKALHEHLRSAYSFYCNALERGKDEQFLKPPTLQSLGEQIGRDKGTVSRILGDACNKEIQVLWSACKDFDLLKGYGNSHWGKKRQGRVR